MDIEYGKYCIRCLFFVFEKNVKKIKKVLEIFTDICYNSVKCC